MDKAIKKFVLFAEIAILILLTVFMSVINIINFTMTAEDADQITQHIRDHGGCYDKADAFTEPALTDNSGADHAPGTVSTGSSAGNDKNSKRTPPFDNEFGPMGPDSPEMNSSLRYFTVKFEEDSDPSLVVYKISAVSEEEAVSWAESLLGSAKTGWTNMTYRYRIYKVDGVRYVTVIDQSRELLPSYRILLISVCGVLVFMLLSFIILRFVGKWLFKPIEEADRKQKRFIGSIENDFRMPLTIINANTEIMERENGESEQTRTIDRQVRKMTKLVKNLSAVSLFEEKDMTVSRFNLSDMFSALLDSRKKLFDEKNTELIRDIDPDIFIESDESAVKKALGELIDNSATFAEGSAAFSLKKHNERITLIQKNPTSLPNGSCDQVFDRFTRLDNAKDKEGAGLGLSFVMNVVRNTGGRATAKVSDNEFILKIDL